MLKQLSLTLAGLSLGAGLALAAELFEIRNEAEFKKIIAPDAKLTRLATGMWFTEGPVWVPRDGGYLIFSDLSGNQLKKWSAADGLKTFREISNFSNGNCLDLHGRLITAEHTQHRLSRTEPDGTVETLVDQYDGKRLNSPCEVVVKSDGSIWFTDPDYGVNQPEKQQPGNFVFRLDPAKQNLGVVIKDIPKPNGLCFSPDEKRLYVADAGPARNIRVFAVQPDGTVTDGKVFCAIGIGMAFGIRCDADGRLWSSAGPGIEIYAPDGSLIGKIFTRETPANLCFGGPDGKTLFLTARKSLYSIPVLVKGAKPAPAAAP